MLVIRRQDLEAMDNSQPIKPMMDFEGLARVCLDLTSTGTSAVEDSGRPDRDVPFDFELNGGMFTVVGVELYH